MPFPPFLCARKAAARDPRRAWPIVGASNHERAQPEIYDLRHARLTCWPAIRDVLLADGMGEQVAGGRVRLHPLPQIRKISIANA